MIVWPKQKQLNQWQIQKQVILGLSKNGYMEIGISNTMSLIAEVKVGQMAVVKTGTLFGICDSQLVSFLKVAEANNVMGKEFSPYLKRFSILIPRIFPCKFLQIPRFAKLQTRAHKFDILRLVSHYVSCLYSFEFVEKHSLSCQEGDYMIYVIVKVGNNLTFRQTCGFEQNNLIKLLLQ